MTQAYYEAANAAHNVKAHRWTHGIVYAAGRQVGWHQLKTSTAAVTQPQFNRVYKDMVNRMHQGEEFKAPEQVKTTENRLTMDAKKKPRTATESNKSAAEAFKASMKGLS